MSREQATRLDRLFPRQTGRGAWVGISDAWEPAWRPRGRWWMRARGSAGRGMFKRPPHTWTRLLRPGRAA